MFKDTFEEFETIIDDCLDYINSPEEERRDDVQNIYDHDHDAYVVVQPK